MLGYSLNSFPRAFSLHGLGSRFLRLWPVAALAPKRQYGSRHSFPVTVEGNGCYLIPIALTGSARFLVSPSLRAGIRMSEATTRQEGWPCGFIVTFAGSRWGL